MENLYAMRMVHMIDGEDEMIPTIHSDVVVIGGGPAGLAAAIAAKENGADRVMILERDRELGGILQQCIHTGFGLQIFKEELTGPEYASRFIERAMNIGVQSRTNTMVLGVRKDRTVLAVNPGDGLVRYIAGAVVLAMGCRERTRGALAIPGTRPAGIFTAGTVQRYVNMEGYMPGRKIVILGSGDVGMIMARRLTLEGAEVKAVIEIYPYPGGLTRNVVQCLEDFGIPLLLSHTVTKIEGRERVSSITISRVDDDLKPVPGTEEVIECDTLLLSVGLIPENELSRELGIEIDPRTGGPVVTNEMETSIEGIFACGNAVHVNDLVDNVTREGIVAGSSAAIYARKGASAGRRLLQILPGEGVRYVVPQRITLIRDGDAAMTGDSGAARLSLRVARSMISARINLVSQGRSIPVARKRRARPSEMIDLPLRPDLLREIATEKSVFLTAEEGV